MLPLSGVFGAIVFIRKKLYQFGLFSTYKPAAPVIIVGNISVGGNGKTPLVIAISAYLAQMGLRPGILSRGYGSQVNVFPYLVKDGDDARWCGDEPRLMAGRQSGPVVLDPERPRGAEYLVNELGCNVIVCDDGLQHYALARDIELIVMDNRKTGNGRLLPAGFLREPESRLRSVDAIIHNVPDIQHALVGNISAPQFQMTLAATHLRNVLQPEKTQTISEFAREKTSALAGIGNPARFFNQLEAYGINLSARLAFSDHYRFVADDVPSGRVVMTEKDAVKIAPFAHDDCWYLPVDAVLPDSFYEMLNTSLKNSLPEES